MKHKGKQKGYPLDSKKINYRKSGNYTFDVTEATFSKSQTSFFVQLTPIIVPIPMILRNGTKGGCKKEAGNFKFMPKGDINEATLVFYTTDAKGNNKRENLNYEAYKQRKKREAKAEGLKR